MFEKTTLLATAAFVMAIFISAKSLPAADARATPPANDQYRVMYRSISPNGRYAIALGFDKKHIDWKSLYKKPGERSPGHYTTDPDDKLIRNYVVDLKTARILGITGGRYSSTGNEYTPESCDFAWSRDSSIFVQVVDSTWHSSCYAGRITAGKLAGVIDLQAEAGNFACKFLADQKNGAFLKHNRDFETRIASFPSSSESKNSLKVGNDGVIELKLSGLIPDIHQENRSFEVIERIKLTAKMAVELVDIHYAP